MDLKEKKRIYVWGEENMSSSLSIRAVDKAKRSSGSGCIPLTNS
jgi:hypothetical protein